VIRLAVRAARADAPALLAELLVFSPAGLEEVDIDDETVEYAIYGAPGALPSAAELAANSDVALLAVHTSEVADDWSERWREFHQPTVVSERLYVRPPWLPPRRQSDRGAPLIDLVIEPGQAFGTGAHATTRLCLELLVARERDGAAHGSLLDLGCGSGVLAIAAAKLGWAPVTALDYDPLSVDATIENARVNAVNLTVERFDLRTDSVPPAELVLANLLAPLLATYAQRLADPPPTLIASGLLRSETDHTSALFQALGMSEINRREQGDWAALLMRRNGR
jgi:ribosomal protein L11 methyltransferase